MRNLFAQWILILLPLVALTVLLLSPLAAPAAAPEAVVPDTPVGVTGAFYDWYLAMFTPGVMCQPLLDRAYAGEATLSVGLVARLDRLVDEAEACGFPPTVDPFLCSDAVPAQVQVEALAEATNASRVTVRGLYAGGSGADIAYVDLIREDGRWRLDAVTCR